MDNLLNVNQAAFILKVHPLTIRRYIKERKLKAIKAGGNIRIKESQLTEFNKDFVPRDDKTPSLIKSKFTIGKNFTKDDPFLKLEGRGATVKLSINT